ncbi:MAG TPA: hypothetical protein VGA53_01620 [Candidatus Paceibacterota bacterium]
MSTIQKGIVAGLIIVLAGFTSASALLATRAWDPLWNPFRPSPEQVLAQMAQKSKELNTFHLVQNFHTTGNTSKGNFNIDFRFASDIDQTSLDALKAHSSFSINLNFTAQPTQTPSLILDHLALEGEVISIDGTSYVRLSSLSLPESFETFFDLFYFGLDPNQLTNQWIKIDQKELLAFSGISPEMAAQELQKQTQLQIELQEILLSPQFYVIRQELPDEEVDGRKMYHYVLEIKVAEMIDAVFAKIFEQEDFQQDQFAAEVAKVAIKGVMETFIEKIGPITSDMWIDKQTLYLRKAAIQKTIDLKQFDPTLEGTSSFEYEMTYSDFNKSVAISAPTESASLQELFETLLEPLILQQL